MRSMNRLSRYSLALAGLFLFGAEKLRAEPLVVLSADNRLIAVDSSLPGTALSNVAVTGLQAGENLLGLDFRPANGTLYALGSTSRLYTLNLSTGAATQVGTDPFATALSGTDFGFDFNPVPDRVRIISDTGQSLRINPDTGAVAGVDTPLSNADVTDTSAPQITGVAYTNAFAGAATTTLFGIDATDNSLVLIGGLFGTPSPNGGVVTSLGSIGVDTTTQIGMDISPLSGAFYLSMQRTGQTTSELFQLGFGDANPLARLGSFNLTAPARDIAAPPLDVTAPTLAVSTPTVGTAPIKQRGKALAVSGTASDNLLLVSVQFRTTKGSNVSALTAATGTTSWSFNLDNLAIGVTTVEVIATDLFGNETTTSFQVNRTKPKKKNQKKSAKRNARR